MIQSTRSLAYALCKNAVKLFFFFLFCAFNTYFLEWRHRMSNANIIKIVHYVFNRIAFPLLRHMKIRYEYENLAIYL